MPRNDNTPNLGKIIANAIGGIRGGNAGGQEQRAQQQRQPVPISRTASTREGIITNPGNLRRGIVGISSPQKRTGGIITGGIPSRTLGQSSGTSGRLFGGGTTASGSGGGGGKSSVGSSIFAQANKGAAQEQASQDYEKSKSGEGNNEGSYEYDRGNNGESPKVLMNSLINLIPSLGKSAGTQMTAPTGPSASWMSVNEDIEPLPADWGPTSEITVDSMGRPLDMERKPADTSQTESAVEAMTHGFDRGNNDTGSAKKNGSEDESEESNTNAPNKPNSEEGSTPFDQRIADQYLATATEGDDTENTEETVETSGNPLTYNGSTDVESYWNQYRQAEDSGLSDEARAMGFGDFIINGGPEDWYNWVTYGPLAQSMYSQLARDYDNYDAWYDNWFLPNEGIDIIAAANAMDDDWYNVTGNNVNTWNSVLDFLYENGMIDPMLFGFNPEADPEAWEKYKDVADYMYGYQYGKNYNGEGWNANDMNTLFGDLSGLEFGTGDGYTYSTGNDYQNVDPTIANARMLFDEQGVKDYINNLYGAYGIDADQLSESDYNYIAEDLRNRGIMSLPSYESDYWGTGAPVQGIRNLAGSMGYGWR